MNLVLDFGNTLSKYAIFDHDGIREIVSAREPSLTRIMEFARKYRGISHCILSSVIEYPDEIRSFLSKSFDFIELNSDTPVPLTNLYRTPFTLGKDRLAAAVAGACLFPNRDVLVINAGTCITYEFVNRGGEYLGGAISPGMEMRFKALNTFTGKLPLLSFTGEFEFPGDSTEKSIQTGVLSGIIAEMEAHEAFLRRKYPELKVILSGGDLIYFDKQLKISIFAFPNIVLHGLNQILELNVKTTT